MKAVEGEIPNSYILYPVFLCNTFKQIFTHRPGALKRGVSLASQSGGGVTPECALIYTANALICTAASAAADISRTFHNRTYILYVLSAQFFSHMICAS